MFRFHLAIEFLFIDIGLFDSGFPLRFMFTIHPKKFFHGPRTLHLAVFKWSRTWGIDKVRFRVL